MLRGRDGELKIVEALLTDARSGVSGALVIKGEPGVGKSALLDHAVAAAEGARVLRGVGVETEVELPFAALHLLLHPALDRLGALPAPQAAALRGAFGLAPVETADRFLVGLATLSLLAELAEDGPLLAVVDDAQWLDQASAGALLFAARRLRSEGVALLVAARADAFSVTGLPELRLDGLARDDAERLLGDGLPARLRDQVLAEAAGNPLALIELSKVARSGSLEPAGRLPLTERLMSAFAGQIGGLPEQTADILAVAAAEDTGALGIVLAAAGAMGIPAGAWDPAESAGLVGSAGGVVRFRHPLLRAAAYQAVSAVRQRAIHAALAGVVSADRRAWHLALAATGPDEAVAGALELSAERSGARLGFAAMAAAYERSAQLTVDDDRAARRLAAAAEAAGEAGQSSRAADLGERAERLTGDPVTLARLAKVKAEAEIDAGAAGRAVRTLIDGAAAVAATDTATAACMLSMAARQSWVAGENALAVEAARRIARLGLPAGDGRPGLTRGLALIQDGDPEAGYPLLAAFLTRPLPSDVEELLAVAHPVNVAGHLDLAIEVSTTLLRRCRAEGRVRLLPYALDQYAYVQRLTGRHRESRDSAEEALQLARDTGQAFPTPGLRTSLAWLAAVEGDEAHCRALAEQGAAFALRAGVPPVVVSASWALGMLDLTQGRDQAALDRLQARPNGSAFSMGIVGDEVEAAVRLGTPERVAERVARLERWTALSGETWAKALLARCHGLLQDSEEHFLHALELHRRFEQPYEQARTRLAYGEWLRRRRRKADARPHLRGAHEAFDRLGARPWAERAAAELRASGETTPTRRGTAPALALTAQELQVVRLAATGATNRDIAAHLLLSPRTIGQHLYKAFPKLGISSRTELARLDLERL